MNTLQDQIKRFQGYLTTDQEAHQFATENNLNAVRLRLEIRIMDLEEHLTYLSSRVLMEVSA